MAVRQPRLSEQRAWPQARALLRRTALSVLSTRRDQELVRAGDAHEALDSEVSRGSWPYHVRKSRSDANQLGDIKSDPLSFYILAFFSPSGPGDHHYYLQYLTDNAWPW
ncbi:hypothetical protein ZWY2020_049132 [Hordeum vulgare]|nr:hypothetical protein ZWY2020_049132 [Hordeum vulgare]